MIHGLRRVFVSERGRVTPAGFALVALAVGAAGGGLGVAIWKTDAGAVPQVAAATRCWECGYLAFRKAAVGEPTVLGCPRCGKRGFAPAARCGHCGTWLVLNEYRGLAPPTMCPECGREVRHGDR